jgi:hypothetical protein
MVAMFVNGLGRNEQSLQRTFHRSFLPNFLKTGQSEKELPVADMFVNGSGRNEQTL